MMEEDDKLYRDLPDLTRMKIRDYVLHLQVPFLVDKCIDGLWNELKWQSRNVNTWNIYMLDHRKISRAALIKNYREIYNINGKNEARKFVKDYITRYCNKRLDFAESHTPMYLRGFDRPRCLPIQWWSLDLYNAVIGKHMDYEDKRSLPYN